MENLEPKFLREKARIALRRGREPKKLTLWYAGLVVGISLGLTLLNLWLDHQMSNQSGGLGNMGNLAVYDTIQQILPMLSGLVTMCLNLGYLAGMIRISRGQYADQTDLKTGFSVFWPMLRMNMLMALAYFVVLFVSFQGSYLLFLVTPWAEPLVDLLMPVAASGTMVMDDALILEAMSLMTPMLILWVIAAVVLMIPVLFWFRMANYCLLDNPAAGARAAIRGSFRMMRRRFLAMLKIDLSLWPYYLANVLMSLVLYIDILLPLLGVNLPVRPETMTCLCMGAPLVIQFFTLYLLRPQAECTFLMAYDQLREKPKSGEVVLGSIFD